MSVEPLMQRVYALLSDRQFHSGTALAQQCRVSRSAIWKAISQLRSLGCGVEAVPNRGYRAPSATPLLQVERIRSLLPADCRTRLRGAESVWNTGSTNADLLGEAAVVPAGHFDFRTAEYQAAGRGRRTRRWFAPPGGALCLSLAWSFAALPPDISALSLAVGVWVLRALEGYGLSGAALKWPNDIVSAGRKLGGILIELRAEGGGPALVVIGIGLNVAIGAEIRQQVAASGTEAADLSVLATEGTRGAEDLDRNPLAAAVIAACIDGLVQFEREGFRAFRAEWRAADALAGREVLISTEGSSIAGHARGIDIDGALCVQTRDGLRRFVTGEVSVRVAA
jgi:BirA family biotin operon repressor/biotin-[acetyl-CoA-carboxylase] ligase